jgi:PPIC-type PPIASE domain
LLGAIAHGQASLPAPQPGAPGDSSPASESKVGPDTPVITINGVCDHHSAGKPTGSCQRVVTRAEFETMLQAVGQHVSPSARREFAEHFVSALVLEQKAHENGLDQGPDFEARMRIAREQVLAQELNMAVAEHASQVSDQQIEDYYRQNPSRYVEADLTRFVVPGIQQLPAPKEKLSEAEALKRGQESEAIMKAEAEKLRVRAVAGEDFEKLQTEAFKLAEISETPPDVHRGKIRGDNLPASQLLVMELKTGEVSPIIPDKDGYLIYKVGEKRSLPLAEVREDVRKHLAEMQRQAEMNAINKSATPSYDETYFGR